MPILHVFNNPALTLQLGILGILLGLMGRIVSGTYINLAKVSCIFVYVAPPTPVGVWLMVLGLRWRIEYYNYCKTFEPTLKHWLTGTTFSAQCIYIGNMHMLSIIINSLKCLFLL